MEWNSIEYVLGWIATVIGFWLRLDCPRSSFPPTSIDIETIVVRYKPPSSILLIFLHLYTSLNMLKQALPDSKKRLRLLNVKQAICHSRRAYALVEFTDLGVSIFDTGKCLCADKSFVFLNGRVFNVEWREL